MDYGIESLNMHKDKKGKMEIVSKFPLETKEDLSIAYTPGVAEPCKAISKNINSVYDYTIKGNSVAVVTDGSAVLGLGNIGPEASLPVMEGKAVLFKKFANIDAYPICLATQETDKIIEAVKLIVPGFGGINLEDISAPRCFEIERRLKEELDIPVFHDDQHGTAVVVLAGLMNALKLCNKKIDDIEVIVNGAGASGIAISKILLSKGIKNIILCDRTGAIYEGREENMNEEKVRISKVTNISKKQGSLSEVIKGADVFIGVSAPGVLTAEMVKSMSENPIIFAMANPMPEIMPDEAKSAGAFIVATGRSDFPNQINNVLAFPGIFRGALDVRAKDINEEMKIAASEALAGFIEPTQEKIIPSPFDDVGKDVARAVSEAARGSGVARI